MWPFKPKPPKPEPRVVIVEVPENDCVPLLEKYDTMVRTSGRLPSYIFWCHVNKIIQEAKVDRSYDAEAKMDFECRAKPKIIITETL